MLVGKRSAILGAAFFIALAGNVPVSAEGQSSAELIELVSDFAVRIEHIEARTAKTTQKNAVDAAAANSGARGDVPKTEWDPSSTFKSEGDRFEIHVRGRIQADFGIINDNIGEQERFVTEFRRARLGVEGVAWKDVKYKFEIDFADNEVEITDAYLQYKPVQLWTFTFGQFKERVSLDEQTTSRQIAVLERAAFTDAFGFQRRLGIGIDFNKGDLYVNSGIYGGSDISTNEDSEGFVVAVRTFWAPETGNGSRMHIGGSIRHRDLGDGINGTDRYRQRPFAHTSGTRYISTGTLPDIKSDLWYGFEAAGVFGSFWASAEYGLISSSVLSGSESLFNGERSVSFDGGYFELGWFLTGESRPMTKGGWDRPKVNNPLFEGGWGALALVGRLDFLNLNDSSALVYGGKQYSIIVGFSWYLNPNTRIMLNYARTEVSKGFDNVALFGEAVVDPITGRASIDAITGRFQVDW